jgi:predicted DNA-binding protein (UPF0251 family)
VVLDVEGLETKMVRPFARRRIRGKPNSSYFKPAGVRMIDLEEVELARDEFEAIRLVDFNEMGQSEACSKMCVSQSTMSRILKSGRKKIGEAIVSGKAIKIRE